MGGIVSVARFDLRLSWEEFADLTPGMFAALCKRRNIRLKHERFANALTASAVYNVHRAGADVPMVTAYDFVRDAKQSEAHEQTQLLKRQIQEAVTRMPANTPREKFMKVRAKHHCRASQAWTHGRNGIVGRSVAQLSTGRGIICRMSWARLRSIL